jgi:hypothetical protein
MLFVSLLFFAVRTPAGTPDDPYRQVREQQQMHQQEMGQRRAARRLRTRIIERETDLQGQLDKLKERRAREEENGKLADPAVLAEIEADEQRIQQELDALRAELKKMADDAWRKSGEEPGNGNGNHPEL